MWEIAIASSELASLFNTSSQLVLCTIDKKQLGDVMAETTKANLVQLGRFTFQLGREGG